MGKKRGRLQIIHDILSAVRDKGGKIKPTHLLYKSNLSHQMMGEYLHDLIAKGFMEEEALNKRGKQYILTQRGYDYLQEYKKILSFVENFGLEDE